MPHALTPAFGARFELLRQQIDDAAVVYAVTIYMPTGTQNIQLSIGRQSGDCQLSDRRLVTAANLLHPAMPDQSPLIAVEQAALHPSQETQPTADVDLPPWIHKHLLALARQLFRDAQRDGQWLRRLLRWHEDPHVVERRGQRASKPDAPSPAET